MIKITSPTNHRLSEIRRLRQRKERNATGLAYLEGLRIVTEAVHSCDCVQSVIWCPELLTSKYGQELVDKAYNMGYEILILSEPAFDSLALKEGPQGIAAVIKQYWNTPEEIEPNNKSGIVLALYQIADPGNLGTIFRTADAVGCRDIVMIDDCTDPYDPSALRASMGTIFSHRKTKMRCQEFVVWAKEAALPVVATSDQAEQDYHDFRYPNPTVLLMGSERQGLPAELFDICSEAVRIPMNGNADSLNLSIATAVCLYEIYNQRRTSKAGEA